MDREKVMSWLEGLAQQDWRMFHSNSEVQIIAEHALALLKEQVAVVRCKDCKFSHVMDRQNHPKANKCWCEKDFIEGWHEQEWFCADGVRKE